MTQPRRATLHGLEGNKATNGYHPDKAMFHKLDPDTAVAPSATTLPFWATAFLRSHSLYSIAL